MRHVGLRFFTLLLCVFSVVSVSAARKITPENALSCYLNNKDKSFAWQIKDSAKTDGAVLYRVQFTSQRWQNSLWHHEMIVTIPNNLASNKGLLFIQGGTNDKEGNPIFQSFTDPLIKAFAAISIQTKAVSAILSQVPNQPLFDGKTEDGISVITLAKFQQTGDYSFPIWFPMTKTAVKSLDAIELLVKETRRVKMDGFVVSGGSKRGWTTWLTAAMDKRIVGAAPMVIDVLNMPVNIDYQMALFGKYSDAIADYTSTGFSDLFVKPEGKDIITMIDPFSYRKTMTMPKIIINATNDPFWTADAIKNYIDEIPGKNLISYAANVGHGLGDKRDALGAMSAFFYNTIYNKPMPEMTYTYTKSEDKITFHIKTSPEGLKDVVLWAGDSNTKSFVSSPFRNKPLGIANQATFNVEVKYAPKAFRAFYISLEYENPVTKGTYNVCTRMFICSQNELFDQKHEIGKR